MRATSHCLILALLFTSCTPAATGPPSAAKVMAEAEAAAAAHQKAIFLIFDASW